MLEMKQAASVLTRKRELVPDPWARWLGRFLWVCGPLVGYTLVEFLNHNNGWTDFTPVQVALNLGWYYAIAGVMFLLIGRRSLSAGVSTTLFWVIGMANHYVIAFRGRTIFPADLLTLRTAANVAANYDYTFDMVQWGTLAALLVYLALLALLPWQKGRKMPRLSLTLPACGAVVLYVFLFFATGLVDWCGIEPSLWTTRGNGFFLNFTVCLRYSRVEKPEGYSLTALEQIAAEVEEAPSGGTDTVPTNVIVIMGESFADLTLTGDFTTNRDAMPYLRSLTENTVKGTAWVSVFGGTTANSEYEFLTGNTTMFLPAGAVPYQLYVNDSATALPQQMSALGYRTVAMHPYWSSGWNRVAVYEDFGFDETYFLRQFTDTQTMRGYVTDRSNYENLIRVYEAKEPGEPLFLFNVTMQNHSGYNVPWTGLDKSVWLTGANQGRYDTVDQFLSLMYESDRAVEYLLDYFSRVDEPTLILIFGDHQPNVSGSFYGQMLGGAFSGVDVSVQQRRQQTPFVLWANYDIPEAEGLNYSLNYLSALLLEQAGLPLTGYQRLLAEGREVLPVVNAVGYVDETGCSTGDESLLTPGAQEFLHRYRVAQYANLFDPERAPEDFFSLKVPAE